MIGWQQRRGNEQPDIFASLRAWFLPPHNQSLIAAVLLLLLVFGGFSAAILRAGYARDLQEMQTRAEAFSRFLEENTRRNMQAVDLVLQIIIDASPQLMKNHETEFEDWLRRRLKQLPHVRALYTIGPDGFINQDSDSPNTPHVGLADRGYFIAHKQNANLGLHISAPLISRSLKRWFVSVSRRINAADGGFGGVAVAAVEPTFYERVYSELPLKSGDAIALWHADGTLIARVPEDYGIVGQKALTSEVFSNGTLKARDVVIERSKLTGDRRVIGYRVLPDMSLIVTSSLNLADIEKTWHQMFYVAFVSFILLTALSLILIFQLIRRQREREEEQQRAVLQQKHEAVARTASGLAHDFNNLLSATEAGLNLALKNADDPNKVRTYITAAQEVIERGGKLTHLLLNFAKRQQGDVSSADLNNLLQELRPILGQAAGPGIQINVNPTPRLPTCRIDRTQFESAILNLAINSRDAMPKGGTITIQTRVEPHSNIRLKLKPGTYAVVQVKDNGQGMTPEIARRAFEPFFTTKGEKGTGLGLAQVYRFMHQIGGDARLTSRPGQGTTIELYFPCEDG